MFLFNVKNKIENPAFNRRVLQKRIIIFKTLEKLKNLKKMNYFFKFNLK